MMDCNEDVPKLEVTPCVLDISGTRCNGGGVVEFRVGPTWVNWAEAFMSQEAKTTTLAVWFLETCVDALGGDRNMIFSHVEYVPGDDTFQVYFDLHQGRST